MADVFSPEKRTEIMRKVQSCRNKSTELKFIQIFKLYKITGWRRNFKLFGKPDFVFPKKKIAIFLDGCFWHGHDCRNTKPKDNQTYWDAKLKRNQMRDKLVSTTLMHKDWNVIRIWECELKEPTLISEKLIQVITHF